MQIPKNKFKAYFSEQQQSGIGNPKSYYGCWNGLADTIAAEIIAGSGFDWILIDGEHAPFDLRTIQYQLQAFGQFDTPVLVRPPHGDSNLIKQLLDIGVQSLVVPMVETAEQAAALYKAMQYPPIGIRGVGTALARAAQWNRVNNYFKTAGDEMCLIVQIESVKGIENLESIVATEGVDGVFIGPSDLAASMGYIGQADRAEVKATVEKALTTIRRAGKIAGVMVIGNQQLAEHYAACGANMIAIAIDTLLLANAAKQVALTYTKTNVIQSNTKY
jgi:4-hydroxy-2-oxoheptanedioate aldolase